MCRGVFTVGIALIEVMPGDNAVVSTNAINDYSYVNARSTNDVQLTRCATGLQLDWVLMVLISTLQ